MRNIKNTKGMMLTLAAALFVVVMLSLVIVNVSQNRVHDRSLTYRVRCDELNYFLNDMQNDLQRSAGIAGKRALTYAIISVSTNGTPINGSDKFLDELTVNGTISGQPLRYMENQSLKKWKEKVSSLGPERQFITNLNDSLIQVDIVPHSPFDFWVRVRIKNLEVKDKFGYCSFNGSLPRNKKWIISNVSIIGLEDPLYILKTHGYVSRTFYPDTNYTDHSNSNAIIFDIENKLYNGGNPDAPSIFERLEGNLGDPVNSERHEYYIDKAYNAIIEEGTNVSKDKISIGPESFVDVSELQSRIPSQLQPQIIKENQSVMDHVYFGPAYAGKKLQNVTQEYSWFRIDSAHARFYNISSSQLYD